MINSRKMLSCPLLRSSQLSSFHYLPPLYPSVEPVANTDQCLIMHSPSRCPISLEELRGGDSTLRTDDANIDLKQRKLLQKQWKINAGFFFKAYCYCEL